MHAVHDGGKCRTRPWLKSRGFRETIDWSWLWLHHVPWDSKFSSKRTLWEEPAFRYNGGVEPEIHAPVMKKHLEAKESARQRRDACVRCFLC